MNKDKDAMEIMAGIQMREGSRRDELLELFNAERYAD